jgi:RNA-directed DNA polymerase
VNIGAPWPTPAEAEVRVLRMQRKLHQWAISVPDRRFDDLFNLVHDPAVLVVAWRRVRGNKGKRSGGVHRVAPVDTDDVAGLLAALRDDLKAQEFVPLPARERKIPKAGGKLRRSQQLEDRLVTDAFLHRAYQTLIRNHLEGNPDLLLVSRTFRRR